jgi:hypothetical protein
MVIQNVAGLHEQAACATRASGNMEDIGFFICELITRPLSCWVVDRHRRSRRCEAALAVMSATMPTTFANAAQSYRQNFADVNMNLRCATK